ncbi:serine hydrolase domain-containing protein [Maricaulis sp.]|uniref:serine hydrolase domain-containing protein n=1 Tax=Maricaulis sp. TaxID=1486257 RepID=UPI003A9083EB
MKAWVSGLTAMLVLSVAGPASAAAQTTPPVYALDCDRAEAYSRQARGVAVIIVHAGDIVCERYADGIEPDEVWEIASGVKSFTGVMAAAAVQDGLLSLDERAADTLTEWQDDPERAAITVRHLLSQSSGLALPRESSRLPGYRAAIQTRARTRPGEVFAYGPRHFQAFGELLRRKLEAAGLDATPAHYLGRRVLAPLGIDVRNWAAVDGMPVLSEGASISPLDWARFGHFVLHDGDADGTGLVDSAAMAALFEPSAANPAYGLGWWLPHPRHAGSRGARGARGFLDTLGAGADFPELHVAAGAGGQRLYLFPELDLVVVRMTRGVDQDPATRSRVWSDRRFIEHLLVPQAAVTP